MNMNGIAYQRTAKRFAKTLATRAALPFLFAAILTVYMPPLDSLLLSGPARAILIGAAAAGFIAILLSFYLLFDAVLFLKMSRYRDEQAGGAAIDALLARMKLRAMPQGTRTLAERIDGTSRFFPLHRTALTASVASIALTLFLSGTQ